MSEAYSAATQAKLPGSQRPEAVVEPEEFLTMIFPACDEQYQPIGQALLGVDLTRPQSVVAAVKTLNTDLAARLPEIEAKLGHSVPTDQAGLAYLGLFKLTIDKMRPDALPPSFQIFPPSANQDPTNTPAYAALYVMHAYFSVCKVLSIYQAAQSGLPDYLNNEFTEKPDYLGRVIADEIEKNNIISYNRAHDVYIDYLLNDGKHIPGMLQFLVDALAIERETRYENLSGADLPTSFERAERLVNIISIYHKGDFKPQNVRGFVLPPELLLDNLKKQNLFTSVKPYIEMLLVGGADRYGQPVGTDSIVQKIIGSQDALVENESQVERGLTPQGTLAAGPALQNNLAQLQSSAEYINRLYALAADYNKTFGGINEDFIPNAEGYLADPLAVALNKLANAEIQAAQDAQASGDMLTAYTHYQNAQKYLNISGLGFTHQDFIQELTEKTARARATAEEATAEMLKTLDDLETVLRSTESPEPAVPLLTYKLAALASNNAYLPLYGVLKKSQALVWKEDILAALTQMTELTEIVDNDYYAEVLKGTPELPLYIMAKGEELLTPELIGQTYKRQDETVKNELRVFYETLLQKGHLPGGKELSEPDARFLDLLKILTQNPQVEQKTLTPPQPIRVTEAIASSVTGPGLPPAPPKDTSMTIKVTVPELATDTAIVAGTTTLNDLNILSGDWGNMGMNYETIKTLAPDQYGQIQNSAGTIAAYINGKMYVIDPPTGLIVGEADADTYNCSYDNYTGEITFKDGATTINGHPVTYMGVDSNGFPVSVSYNLPTVGAFTVDTDGNYHIDIANADSVKLNGNIPLEKDADGKFIIPKEYAEQWLLENWQITATISNNDYTCSKDFNRDDLGITLELAARDQDPKVTWNSQDTRTLLTSEYAGLALAVKPDLTSATSYLKGPGGEILASLLPSIRFLDAKGNEGTLLNAFVIEKDGEYYVWGHGEVSAVTEWLDEDGQQSRTTSINVGPALPLAHDDALSIRARLDSPLMQTLPPGLLTRESLKVDGQDFFEVCTARTGGHGLDWDYVLPSGKVANKGVRFSDTETRQAAGIIAGRNSENIFGEEDLETLIPLVDLLKDRKYKDGLQNADRSILSGYIYEKYGVSLSRDTLLSITDLYDLAKAIADTVAVGRAERNLQQPPPKTVRTPNITNDGKGGLEIEASAGINWSAQDSDLGKLAPEAGFRLGYSWSDRAAFNIMLSGTLNTITGTDAGFEDSSMENLKAHAEFIYNFTQFSALAASAEYIHLLYNRGDLPWMNMWRAGLDFRQYLRNSTALLPYYSAGFSLESIGFQPDFYDDNGPGGIQTLTLNPLLTLGLTNEAKTWNIKASAAPRFNLSDGINKRSIYNHRLDNEPFLDLPVFELSAAHNNLLAFTDTGKFRLPGLFNFGKIASTGELNASLGLAWDNLTPGLNLIGFNVTGGVAELYQKDGAALTPKIGFNTSVSWRQLNATLAASWAIKDGKGLPTVSALMSYKF
jgi:hypothetical protein